MQLNPAHLLLLFRCLFILVLTAITCVSLLNPTELPPVTLQVWDKMQHALAYVLLSFLLQRSFPDKAPLSAGHGAQMVFLLLYGVVIEYVQGLTPYREASLSDVVANSVGIAGYCLFYLKSAASRKQPHKG